MIAQKDNESHSMSEELRQLRSDNTDFARKIKSLEDDVEQLNEENQAMEEQKTKHQQTLESNRNLIKMLKNELEKSIEKNKVLESAQISNTTSNGAKDTELHTQIEKL